MEFKGTKGEWKATRNVAYWEVNAWDKQGNKLSCAVWHYDFDKNMEAISNEIKSETNAKLIAAAPELLDALLFAINQDDYASGIGRKRFIVIAKTAIEKALL
jgi:hypothetical protein